MREIRIAENAEEIASLEQKCFDLPWSINAINEELSQSTTLAFVLYDNNKPIGYILVALILDEAELYRIGVDPLCRHEGNGRLLVERIIEECQNNSVSSIFLEVRASNNNAVELYRNTGFEILGTRRNYYDKPVEDALIMRKEV